MNPEACVETTCCSVSGHGKLLLPNRRASTARYLVELTPDLRGRGLLCGSENSLRRAADLEFVDVHIAGGLHLRGDLRLCNRPSGLYAEFDIVGFDRTDPPGWTKR